MKQLIINADDFGINKIVNNEIEKLISSGAISSTTIMANGASLEEASIIAKRHPEISYGVHLCLSEFESLTKSKFFFRAGLTDEKGFFIKKAIFHSKVLEDDTLQRALSEELHAQIDVVSSMGIKISHADSHHHVHSLYSLRHVFADVLNRRGINKLRLCYGYNTLRSKLHFYKYLRHVALNNFYRRQFLMTDFFYDYSSFFKSAQLLKDGQTIELMCHPGHPANHYKQEMQLVETKQVLSDKIQLITFNDLRK